MKISACVAFRYLLLVVTKSSATCQDARVDIGVMYPRWVNACGKEIFAIRSQLQAVTGGWKLQVLYELNPPPASNS